MTARHRPDMHYPSIQEYLPAYLPQGCGREQEGHQAYLYRPERACGISGAGRTGREMGDKYAAMIRLWRNAWSEFVPLLNYDTEIRKVVCSTNAIESLNARYRRAVKARGHFPTEQAALKCLYLVTRSLDPTGTGRTRWTMRWKPALNAFAITFADRFPSAETY